MGEYGDVGSAEGLGSRECGDGFVFVSVFVGCEWGTEGVDGAGLIIVSAWDGECVCVGDDGSGWECCLVRARLEGRGGCGNVCEDVRTLLPDASGVCRLSKENKAARH